MVKSMNFSFIISLILNINLFILLYYFHLVDISNILLRSSQTHSKQDNDSFVK